MKKITSFILAALVSTQLFAVEIGGIDMPDTLKKDETSLNLNGAGTREKFFMDLYVGGLYLKGKTQNANDVVNADEAMALRLHIVSGLITSEKMLKATKEGFENSLGEKKNEAIQAKIDTFLATFKDEIKKGDIFEMVYVPSEGVKVYKNATLANTINGIEFKQALFGIWLSENPAQQSLKEEMLDSKS
ncbi:chalcone isomerase [Gammaproteobacteria bacterium 42_54_T18]|nr:chalcone isomerase [Gammaproteobacteria bacterium 42_54_T18]